MANRTEPYLASWLHSQGGKQGLPIGGNFELTARCNFNCPMCYVHLQQQDVDAIGRELTAQQWIELARQARDRGMMFALLTGGEPFVRKDFFEIYEAMQSMGIMISINSNGSLLRGETLQRLLETPPMRLNISLYGGCRETYQRMCGQDVFETVTENIQTLKKAGVDVRLNLSLTPDNIQDMEQIYAISQRLNVHVKASSYMYPPVRSKNSATARLTAEDAARYDVAWDLLRFTPEEFAQRAHALRALSAVDVRDCTAVLDEGVSCRAGYSSFWITWDGQMLPCAMMPYPAALPLQTGFDAAWAQIKREVREIRTPKECAACPKREVCAACAAVCITESGRFDGVPEYMCRMTDETLAQTWRAYEERSST